MKILRFHICHCNSDNKYFKKNILINKPTKIYTWTFFINQCNLDKNIQYFSNKIFESKKFLKIDGYYFLDIYNTYIYYDGVLLKPRYDFNLNFLYRHFKTPIINMYYFIVLGGVSEEFRGFRFTIHTDEEIHRNTPHIHVIKNNKSVRYYLETLQRFKQDKWVKEIDNSEKIIIKHLRKNKDRFLKMWYHYIFGFDVPDTNENNKQYYDET